MKADSEIPGPVRSDLAYYCRRRDQEAALAAMATSPEAAAAHAALAAMHRERARRLMPHAPRLRLIVSNPPGHAAIAR